MRSTCELGNLFRNIPGGLLFFRQRSSEHVFTDVWIYHNCRGFRNASYILANECIIGEIVFQSSSPYKF